MLDGVQSMMLVGVQSIHQWIVSLPAAVLESFSFQYKNFISPKTVKFKSNPMEAHHITYSSCSNLYSCCIALKRKDLAIDDLLLDCFKQFSLPNIQLPPQ